MAPVAIKRVLISESVDPCCKKILQENGVEVTERTNMNKEELKAQIEVSDKNVFNDAVFIFSRKSLCFRLRSLSMFISPSSKPGLSVSKLCVSPLPPPPPHSLM